MIDPEVIGGADPEAGERLVAAYRGGFVDEGGVLGAGHQVADADVPDGVERLAALLGPEFDGADPLRLAAVLGMVHGASQQAHSEQE